MIGLILFLSWFYFGYSSYSNKTGYQLNVRVMKNALIIIAGLLIVIWAIVFFSFNTSGIVHLLLVAAGFLIMFWIVLHKIYQRINRNLFREKMATNRSI